jgi:predicted Zn finger-like uncharacterized protein
LPEHVNYSPPAEYIWYFPLMQLACPNCSARYLVDPVAIGPTGRTVQCFRCGCRWRASAPQPATDGACAAAPSDDAKPVPDVVIRPQSQTGTTTLPAIPADPGLPLWLKAVIGALALIALIGGGGYLLRSPPAPTLVVDQQSAKIDRIAGPGGKTVIVVSGDIVNAGRTATAAKQLHLMFKDAAGKLVAERSVDISTGPIPPKGRARFETRIEDPPATSAEVGLAAE